MGGDPGEVCVSSTVKELVVGSGLEFTERGVHTLHLGFDVICR